MDKREAKELLEQELVEIACLRELPCNNDGDNEKFKLWRYKVLDIIEAAFGKDSSEYRRIPIMPIKTLTFEKTEAERKQEYNEYLDKYETALKSIIQKYEMLGIEEKSAKAESVEIPKELELVLEGTPDMILECIRSTAEKLSSQGYMYGFRRTSGTPDNAKWDKTYSASCAISQNEEQIGNIKLRLLPKEQTLLSVTEPKDWGSSFGVFLSYLVTEFKRLRFVYFEEEKPPIGFKLPHKEKNV